MQKSLLQFIEDNEVIDMSISAHDPVVHPYTGLFNAVILQALLDISKEPSYPDQDREEAMAWFFSSVVSVINNFEEVCDLAGVRAIKVKECATKILETADKESLRKQIRYYLHDRK